MDFLVFSTLGIGLLVVVVLFIFGSKRQPANVFLALSIFCAGYGLFATYLHYSKLILQMPWAMRTGNLFSYLILPFYYLYVRQNLYPGKVSRRLLAVLMFPAVLFLVDMMPLFLEDPAVKQRLMADYFQDMRQYNKMKEGWICPQGFHFIFRYIWSASLLGLTFWLLWRNRSNGAQLSPNTHNRQLFRFMAGLWVPFFLLVIPGLFFLLFLREAYSLAFVTINTSIIIIGVAVYLLVSPNILYGFLWQPSKAWSNRLEIAETAYSSPLADQPSALETAVEEAAEKPKTIDPAQEETLVAAITEAMHQRKLYLKHSFTIHDLARELDIPVYQLSPLINRHYGINFNHWINTYRIQDFITRASNPDQRNLTLEALANESGFNSRITFFNAFKKIKGCTPSEFLKMEA